MEVQAKSRDDRHADPVAEGARLGFYEALSREPVTAAELAGHANAPLGLVHDWLTSQAREGYVVHDAATDRYANFCSLPRVA